MYYFVVQTRTNPVVNYENTLDSEFSREVSARTQPSGGSPATWLSLLLDD